MLYHGSPRNLDILKPRQANWQDSLNRRYADGAPAICADSTPRLPIVRAILHETRAELQNRELVLAKRTDRHGRAHWFTSEEALTAIDGADAYLYPFVAEKIIMGHADPHSIEYNEKRREYRVYGDRQPIVRLTVGVEDLPPDLCVIYESDVAALNHLPACNNPRELSDLLSIPVRPLGGMWPTEYFPS